MGQSAKPRKKYVPKWNAGTTLRTQLWKLAAVFGPVESIIDKLDRDGEITTDANGKPLFNDAIDGCHYAMGPSLRGLTDAFDLHSARHGRPVMTGGLLALLAKLEADSDLEYADLVAARASVAAMRNEAAQMEARYASRLVRDTQIKFELENKLHREAA